MKRKICNFILICTLLFALALTFSACDLENEMQKLTGMAGTTDVSTNTDATGGATGDEPGDATDEHTHAFGEWTVVTAATCEETGLEERVCSCEEKETREIAAVGHTEVIDSAVEPTCTATGLTEGKHCSVCEEILVSQEIVKENGHNFVEGFCHCGVSDGTVSVGLLYELSEDEQSYILTGIGTCEDNDIIIPRVYRGLPIKSIAQEAFFGCKNLTSITISNSVKEIGEGAFSYCSGLKSVTISNSVTAIGNYAFSDCNSLASITIPDGVTSIGAYAFNGCTGLTRITIPDGVTSIGAYAFKSCTGLTRITIPDSVKKIGNCAFSNCKKVASVSFGANSQLTAIDQNAFSQCTSLISITIPDGVTSIGENAFFGCKNLTSITISNSVKEIAEGAFDNCNSLYLINNNSNLDLSIGSKDDGYIAHYAKIIVDKSGNTTYRDDGFQYIISEDDFLFAKKGDSYKLIAYLGEKATVTLPKNINGNYYSIYRMRGVINVIIPNSVMSIDSEAFEGCTGLTSITISDSVTSIGTYAFYECINLASVTIGNGVTSIEESAFSGCSSLASVTIGNGVTSIEESVFSGCESLTSVTIPDSVTRIGDYVFSNCTSLTSVTIPNSVTKIGDYVFDCCDELTSITFEGTKEQWTSIRKGSKWITANGDFIIHCTDGDIKMN